MKNEILEVLEEYGLSKKEAEIFLFLVGNNRTTAYEIAKRTGIFKSTCYDVLKRLIEKGFVAELTEENKKVYLANDIDKVLGIIKSKESLLVSLKPKLQNLELKEETFTKHLESNTAFLGLNFKIAELARKGKLSFIYMIGNNPHLTTQSSAIQIARLINEFPKKINNKIMGRGLWDPKFENEKFKKQFDLLGENRFITLPSQVTIIIFDGYVAFFFIEDKPNVIEIKNRKIAEEMKAYFELLWKIAKK